MSRMTPFCRAVVKTLKTQPNNQGVGSYTLREALMWQGWGKHPAAVAMNLTKLAFKGEYITSFVHNSDRIFMLTEKGRTTCTQWRWDGMPGDTCVCGLSEAKHKDTP